jgi:asparagine synthase (glutamine-hydrolysing)
MNLFLVGWQLPQDRMDLAVSELNTMAAVYPQLDPTTCRSMGAKDGRVFAATMHSPDQAIAPRRYAWQTDEEFTFYDGVLFDRTGSFAAYDAEELARHWSHLPEKLEGQFVAVRVRQNPAAIEVMTDLLGLVQVYVCRCGDSWLISNSVRLLVRLCGAYDLDPLGVSMFLSQTWVWDDRTLRKDIRTIPAGQLWKFEAGKPEPRKQTYYSAASFVPAHKQCLSPREVRYLAENMAQSCRLLDESLGPLRCGLTGGRDSRLVMSVLVHGGIEAPYFTSGDPANSRDIELARAITKELKLSYEIRNQTSEDALEQWEILCHRLIRQGDGMISLWQLPDVLNQPQEIDRLTISLSGLGGGIAKGHYYTPLEALGNHSPDEIVRMLREMIIFEYGGLVLPAARELTAVHLRECILRYFDEGLTGLDVSDAFFTYHRQGRWGGINRNKLSPVYDPFALLCTRAFVEAVFTLPPAYRKCHWLHHQLLSLLAPNLAEFPFDSGRELPQSPRLNLLRWILERSHNKVRTHLRRRFPRRRSSGTTAGRSPEFGQAAWLEIKRDWMRSICLDQRDSMLWEFLNRSLFEQIMSDSADPAARQAYRLGIYGIATLFYYEGTEKSSE